MPIGPVPDYPPAKLTTGELRRARADLEHRLTGRTLSDARQYLLRQELNAVIAEQDERAATAHVPCSGPPVKLAKMSERDNR